MWITLLADDARQAVVTDKLVLKICDDVGTCWEDLDIMLKLSAAAVRNLDADFRRSREKAREVLHIWMEMEGNAATVKNLERALMGIGKKAIAQKLLGT